MDDKGVYAIARSIWESDAFLNQKYTQREAWMWLVGAAVWKEARINIDGRRVTLNRGEFAYSVRFLAVKWKWSKSTVSRFLVALEKCSMIWDTSRDGVTVFSITKYNDFQVVGLPRGTPDGTPDGTPVGQARDSSGTNKKHDKHDKHESKEVEAPKVAPSKPTGSRWPSDRDVPPDWIAKVRFRFGEMGRAPPDLALEAVKFANFWASKSGKDATKVDWEKTFLNWCLNARTTDQRSFAERKFDNLKSGAGQSAAVDRGPGPGVESPSNQLIRLAISNGS